MAGGTLRSTHPIADVNEGWGIRLVWEQISGTYNIQYKVYFELRQSWSDLDLDVDERVGTVNFNGKTGDFSIRAGNYENGSNVYKLIPLTSDWITLSSVASSGGEISISAELPVAWTLRGHWVTSFNISGTGTLDSIMESPNAPTSVTANLNSSTVTTIDLSWDHSTTTLKPVDRFRVQQGYKTSPSGSWSSWGSESTTTSKSQSRTELTKGRWYQFRVRAENGAGSSSWATSNECLVPLPPNQPTLSASLDSTNETTVELSWSITTASNRPISSFTLQRRLDGESSWTNVSTSISSGSRAYDNTGRTRGNDYQYRIRANGPRESGSYSSTVTIRVPFLAPNKPTNLIVERTAHDTFRLTWGQTTSSSRPVHQYEIYRRSRNGTQSNSWSGWSRITTINYNSSSLLYDDKTVALGTTYQYYIIAKNTDRSTQSGNSNVETNPSGIPLYNGSVYHIRPVYVYDGTSWHHRGVFQYDGSNWHWKA